MTAEQLTLVVTTRGRVASMHRLFESLVAQTNANFTVLLGDQSDSDVLVPLLAQYGSRLTIHRIQLKPQSLSKARNALLPLAKGKYIALTDDDCYYAPDCLAHIVNTFAKSNADGLIANPNGIFSGQDCTESRYSIFKDAPSWVLFFTRQAVESVGRFDEALGIGSDGPYQSGEETDYLIRLLDAGGNVWRTHLPIVYHDEVDCSDEDCIQKARWYAMGRMYLLRKHQFQLWFKMVNVLFPLARMMVEPASHRAYRFSMLKGRLRGLIGLD